MDLADMIMQIQSHNDLATFIESLRQDFIDNPQNWENRDLSSFLEAMSAWVSDADGYYQNVGQPLPNAEVWRTVASILYASKIYE